MLACLMGTVFPAAFLGPYIGLGVLWVLLRFCLGKNIGR